MRFARSNISGAIVAILVIISAAAILMAHADELYSLAGARSTPFLDLARDHTNCSTKPDTDNGNCVQTVRQMKSLIAAMVAALFTILSVTATQRLLTITFGIIAGATALKAVFHQTMYITDGNTTLPVLILAVAILPSIGVGIAILRAPPNQPPPSGRGAGCDSVGSTNQGR